MDEKIVSIDISTSQFSNFQFNCIASKYWNVLHGKWWNPKSPNFLILTDVGRNWHWLNAIAVPPFQEYDYVNYIFFSNSCNCKKNVTVQKLFLQALFVKKNEHYLCPFYNYKTVRRPINAINTICIFNTFENNCIGVDHDHDLFQLQYFWNQCFFLVVLGRF